MLIYSSQILYSILFGHFLYSLDHYEAVNLNSGRIPDTTI